ncbi:MAG: NAD-dependent succinate-semialdehyde dehydrogenase [Dehalococcoidales bacterium]
MVIKAINPTTGETIKEYEEMPPEEVKRAIEQSHEAFMGWRKTSFAERATQMKKVAQILRDKVEDYAKLMAQEMGKPITGGRAEVEKCAWVCDYYANNAEKLLQQEAVNTDASKSFVTFQPLGVILAVMPWNFPLWQVFRCAAPTLMAGNTVVLKHASNVPGCALALQDIFHKARVPANIFTTLLVSSSQVDAIIGNPLVKAVTFTGSTPAGRAIAKKAGEMLKKSVLELGGSDAYVILEDADIEAAAAVCAASRLTNSGQSCVAAKRFVVVGSRKEEFEELFVRQMQAAKMGDPVEEDTVVGPLARHDLRDYLHQQVLKSIEKGARCLLGGNVPAGRGAFYPPTVLTNVKRGMPAYEEELFGPVAAIISAKDEAEAIQLANDTEFGLAGAIFTKDVAKGERIAVDELEVGCCFINALVKSDPRLPFGGVKESGYGRELSHYGIKEFVNIKTISIK